MKTLRLTLSLMVVLLATSFASTARAASEHIASFDSQVSISQANVATVTETINYDFGTEAHHGIFRYVPAEYTDDQRNHYYTTVEFKSVTRDGQSEPYDVSTSSGNTQAKIGDADQTITGAHAYRIVYTIAPLINQKSGQDHLAFDVTGNGWDVPINAVTATLTYEGSISATSSQCFVGGIGAIDQSGCQASGNTFTTTRPLEAGGGLTIEQFLPAGSFAEYLQPNVRPPFHWIKLLGFAGIIAGLLSLLVALINFLRRLLAQYGRKRDQTIVPEYEAPDALTPAEVGHLIDDRSGMPEITATLIDLAVRGYLKITQLEPGGLIIKKNRYRLDKLKDWGDTADYEQTLLGAIFSAGDSVEMADLDKVKMQAAITSVKARIQSRLEKRQWYGDTVAPTETRKVWWKTSQFRFWAILVVAAVVVSVVANSSIAAPNIGLAVFGLVAIGLSTRAGRMTAAGAKEWSRVKGFRWYLSMVEKDRLKFTDAPAKNPERFSMLLPFAIALGVEKEWAKQFEGIDVTPATGWYGSYHGGFIVPYAIASDLSSGFASTMEANSTVSSGGGGGMSGGGFGGGGGGSW